MPGPFNKDSSNEIRYSPKALVSELDKNVADFAEEVNIKMDRIKKLEKDFEKCETVVGKIRDNSKHFKENVVPLLG
uniref:V-SNARE coiled-coil homology domain-containing protein n=1 Tax=Parastrongyloides trichosuri TaxID=131310 RepID=A0A0N4Z5H4_PARTI